jgi:hypothetical protein
MNNISICLIAISIVVAIGRFTVPGHGLSYPGTYEAFAHIFVGFLFAVAWLRKDLRWLAIMLVTAISLLELIAFLAR